MKIIKTLSLSLLLSLLMFSDVFAEGDENGLIEKKPLIAGEKITLNITGIQEPYEVKWFVNDVENTANVKDDNTFLLEESMYENWIRVEVTSNSNVYNDKVYFSKLPVIYIDTENGVDVVSKEEYINSNIFIQGNKLYGNQYDGEAKIKGRGNTSWYMPKKPYKIKLDSKADLFGFGKNKHWVLLANYTDNSLLRNKTAYDMSNELGLVSMESTWVDVIFNGEYAGDYQLCEHIRIDKNRVDIENIEDLVEEIGNSIFDNNKNDFNDDADQRDELIEEMCENFSWIDSGIVLYNEKSYHVVDYYDKDIDITNGYLFELSDEYDEVSKFLTNKGMKVMINSPEYAFSSEKMQNYCVDLWNDFEEACSSKNGFNAKGQHYSEIGDMDSMVSYLLLNELFGNFDAYYKSRYAYIGDNKKINFGPVWDFDYSSGNYTVSNWPDTWMLSFGLPYRYWLSKPDFCELLYDKYWEYRDLFYSYISDGGEIDKSIEYIYESGIANEKRWNGEVSFKEDTEILKSYLKNRLDWLDKQFSDKESSVRKLSLYSTLYYVAFFFIEYETFTIILAVVIALIVALLLINLIKRIKKRRKKRTS